MLAFWLVCFAWVVGYSLSYGAAGDDRQLSIVGGVPAWVFWGVGVPWMVATVFSAWFALTQMHEDPLDAPDGRDAGDAVGNVEVNDKTTSQR